MPNSLILSNPDFKKPAPEGPHLNVAEFFSDTIQGENIYYPATFLRLQGCTLDCVWCDTAAVWKVGNPYSYDELLDLIEKQPGLVGRYRDGQRFVLSGGSPLKQQEGLLGFIEAFVYRFRFRPKIEVENEVTLMPSVLFASQVFQWNNSPKLSNSRMPSKARYKPSLLKHIAELPNSWFKFVISSEADWAEIQRDFLDPGLIDRGQIVLMPEGCTRDELRQHYEMVVDLCVRETVRFTDRLHIQLWNKKTGV